MKKIMYNTLYKIKYQILWMLFYVLIAVGILVLVYGLLFKTGVLTPSSGSIGYRLWGMLLFQFAVSIRFREDFDLFITLSNSRREFLGTQLAAAVVFSTVIGLCVITEKGVVDLLNRTFGLYVKEFFHIIAVYRSGSMLQIFAFFFIFSFLLSVVGLFIGSLFYRFGKTFTGAFWLVIGSVPLVGIPVLIWPFGNRALISDVLDGMSDFLMTMNINSGFLALLLFSIIAIGATWLSVGTLSQK